MDAKMKALLEDLQKNYKLSNEEKYLSEYSNTAITKQINHSKVLSTLMLIKQLDKSTNKIIHSNKDLAKSEDNHAKKMQYLTWVLVGVGALQLIIMLINVFAK